MKKELKTHIAEDNEVVSPGITSNSSRVNSLKPNDLGTCAPQQPKSVCTPVCTNSASATASPWQPSSPIDRIYAVWPHLPPHIRDTILTLIDSVYICQSRYQVEDQSSVHSTTNNRIKLDGISKDILRRTILKALRHSPELYALQMDTDGWVKSVEMRHFISLITGTDAVPEFDEVLRVFQEIDLIDRVQFKQGFVRATYGHSTEQFAPSTSAIPDQPLFHGTSVDNWSMIECFGLSPAKRRFVQLTTDFDYANQIANSHSRSPIMLKVAAAEAIALGVKFYSSNTHVWLATAVPATCLQVWLDDTFPLEEPLF